MKPWRPKGWDTDKLVDEFDETKPSTEFDYFEAGAAAMLAALRKKGVKGLNPRGYEGYIVFIPDEEKNDEIG